DTVDRRAGKVRRVRVEHTTSVPVPMSEMVLGGDVESVAGELREVIEGYGGSADWLTPILAPYRPGATVAGSFRETVEKLFAGFDLLVTDAADPALKLVSLPVLLGEAEHAAEHERALLDATRQLEAAGYAGQVAVLPDAANLFWHGPAGRERLHRAGDGWEAKEARRRFTHAELMDEIRATPGAFSPNVFLRPVVESSVFPTLAYVAGPGETAYFAQIRPLFQAFGIRMPIVFPRMSAVLVPEEADAALAEAGLAVDDLKPPVHEIVERIARERVPQDVRDRLTALRAGIVDGYAGLIEAAQEVDPNLSAALGAARNRALLGAGDAERKILRHLKRRDGELTQAVELAKAHLYPNGVPQERLLNIFPYLAANGPDLLRDLAAQADVGLETTASTAVTTPAVTTPAVTTPAG
ncbi:MAG TPA: bacillithiol biosynthesis cysteine-adding enzyme BshC, partial [Longimicrobiaceae bacterium]|nr:bacillithiol biosynthesis cysteine-adding enzyme BshC [Longimicrobiaceae bacterium]